MMSVGWTEDRVEVLKKLWLGGQSCREIMLQLGGGVTRSAVIGKVHRLGLPGRVVGSQPTRPGKPSLPKFATPPKPKTVAVLLVPPAPKANVFGETAPSGIKPPRPIKGDVAPAGSKSILDLAAAGECCWPYGLGPYRFCAKPTDRTKPPRYCEEHFDKAYQKTSRPVPVEPSKRGQFRQAA